MPEPKAVHDPQVLRAISHPVRNRILDELSARGSLRAADLARDLGVPANQASFHLRQLAKYGLVEEDPAAARDKRDRVWRVVHAHGLSISFDDLESQPGGAAATEVFKRSATAWGQYLVQQAYQAERSPDTHRSVSDTPLLLTKDEAREMAEEIGAVLERWIERTRAGDADDNRDRRTYLYFAALQPHPGRAADGAGDRPASRDDA